MGILSDALCDELDAATLRKARAIPDLEERLTAIFLHAHAERAGILVDDQTFVSRLGARLSGEEDLAHAIETTQGPDFYLACACVDGDAAALRVLEKIVVRVVVVAAARLKLPRDVVDEVTPLVRQKLLVGEGGPPKIAEYAGRGPLEGWVRVLAARTALTLMRKDGSGWWSTAEADEIFADMASADEDPGVGLPDSPYAGPLRAALAAALAGLPAQDRTVLRLHFVDGRSVDQIGQSYRVDGATVARWIARSRMTLLAQTKNTLRAELGLGAVEFGGLMNQVRSQLQPTLSRLLKRQTEGGKDP